MPQLITCRTINSALWFVNNKELELAILAYLAKYLEKYQVIIYAFVLLGNHYHLLVKFPHGRRSEFFRDFNARIAELVRFYVPEFLGGPLFERRFTPQVLPLDEDLEKYFYYCALQPVSTGLTERISDYDGYNSFTQAATQTVKEFRLCNYGAYNAARRTNPSISKSLFYEYHTLKYEPLPRYQELPRAEYKTKLHQLLEERRGEIIEEHRAKGKSFPRKEQLKAVRAGTIPQNTKKGGVRPLVLSVSMEAKKQYLAWYFSVVEAYRLAVERYRKGEFGVEFPPGTFRPNGMCVNGS